MNPKSCKVMHLLEAHAAKFFAQTLARTVCHSGKREEPCVACALRLLDERE
jgi:hypothetical protein